MYVNVIICIFYDIKNLARRQVAATPEISPGSELDSDHRHSVEGLDDPTELRVFAGDDETTGVTTCKSTETGSYIR